MAATVAASATTASTANATSHTINLPTGIVSGSRLMLYISIDGTPDVTYTGGLAWTEILNSTGSGGTAVRTIVAYYDCSGSEGSTTTVTTSASQGISCVVDRITGHSATAPEATSTTATGSSVDPPSLSPSWGSESTLFGSCCGWDSDVALSSYPTGFDESQNTTRWANSNGTGIAVAYDTQTASSSDPGSWTLGATANKVGVTFAIRSAAVGGTAVPVFYNHLQQQGIA